MSANGMVTEEGVLKTLSTVMDPDLHRNIVELGFVKNLALDGGSVRFDVELTTPACPVKAEFQRSAEERVGALDGVEEVLVNMTANTRQDGRDLLEVAAEIPIRPRTREFPFERANEALQALKRDGIDGSGVLRLS